MAIKIHDRFPGANVRVLAVRDKANAVEIEFAADPHASPQCLWFCFKVVESAPEAPHPAKLTITYRFFNTLQGASSPEGCRPTYHPEGQGWYRCSAGTTQVHADGRIDVSWTIPYPKPSTLVSLCFPYGKEELDRTIQKSKGYWKRDGIGLSQGGRVMERLSNDYGHAKRKVRGVYIVARQHAGEAPGSWVLDGILDRFAREKKFSCLLWAVPFADIDGMIHGDYGKDAYPCDLNRAWGVQPKRHETRVMQQDMHAWAQRCQPILVVDLHAPGACESEGVYVTDSGTQAHADVKSWGNALRQSIGPELAAEDFIRERKSLCAETIGDFARETFQVPTLTIEIPYAICRSTVMTQKAYREMGRSIAKTLLDRVRN